MIEFKGTVKDFLKNYPKDKRKIGVTYRIINSKGSGEYQFIDKVSEKNFKKVEDLKLTELPKDIDGAEMERQEDERELAELKKLAKRILECKCENETVLSSMCKEVEKCTNIQDLANEENCATINRLLCRQVYVDNNEVYWEVLNRKGIVDTINRFINCVASAIRLNAAAVSQPKLLDLLLDSSDAYTLARFNDEWIEKCKYVMSCCKQQCGFDLRKVRRLNNLIYNFDQITDGWLDCLKDIVDDFAWFGETFQTCSDCLSEDYEPRQINVAKEFEEFNKYLNILYAQYGE